ncbi:MAG TPA: MBL fold metallo-hydrolase [Rectinemataceae bacterium]|nr:MBL fold metallo-hydrolase [Rectinemataceae bacterium]
MRQHSVPTPYMVGEVHFYSKEHEGGTVIFDCGPPTKEGKAALAGEVDLKRLRHVFITHCHIDHYGLAPWIEKRSDATIWMPRADLARLRRRKEHERKAAELITAFGFGRAFLEVLRGYFRRTTIMPRDFSRYRTVEDSSLPEGLGLDWIACPGHSQSDLVYLVDDAAISGDVLLRGIFQVPLLDLDLATFQGRFRNYDAWCDSVRKLATLRGRTILPGHRVSVDVDEAILDYVKVLLQRAASVGRYRNLPVPTILAEIFKDRIRDPFFVYLKASEVVFMLDFLDDPGRLKGALESIGLMRAVEELFGETVAVS